MILINKFLINKKYKGMAIWPFIFLREKQFKENEQLLNHEKIHLKQQLELLIVPFYIWYIVEFVFYWIKLKDANKAYYNISFEKEAYDNEKDLNYLKNRKMYSFLKH